VSLFFFWKSFSRMRTAKQDMEQAQSSYSSLVRKKPYPNQPNVDKLEENLQLVSNTFSNDVDPKIRAYTIDYNEKVTRQDFLGEVNQRISDLRRQAAQKNVYLPDTFDLGFTRYVAGMRPEQDDYLPHLLRQLEVSSFLVETAVESEFYQIVETSRLKFESPSAAGGAMDGEERSASMQMGADDPLNQPTGTVDPNPDGNYLEYPFRLTFVTQTSGLRMFMNALVMEDCPYFVVVKEVTVRNLRGIEEISQYNIGDPEGGAAPAPGTPGPGGRMGPGAPGMGGTRNVNPYYPMGRGGTGRTMGQGMGMTAYPQMGATAYGGGDQLPSSGNEYLEVTIMLTAYDFQSESGEDNGMGAL
jgi:hypothetical protein